MIGTIKIENLVSDNSLPMEIPGWCPQVSICFVCGSRLGAYWSKWINLKTGEIRCGGYKSHLGLSYEGFNEWSDG